MTKVRAAVLVEPGRFELRDLDPPECADGGAVLEVEACGLCGTDLDVVRGTIPLRGPVIPGHEVVGRIIAIDDHYADAHGLRVGDRVVVPAELHCGECTGCRSDGSCLDSPGTHGFLPVDAVPALSGGYAEQMVLSTRTRPLPMAGHVPVARAALFNLLGAGCAWAVEAADLRAGMSIAVLGPGQRGLACVLAATDVGARVVAVSGLGERDRHRLDVAGRLGAESTVDVAVDSVVDRVLDATAGLGVDVVVDTTPHATQPVLDAVRMVRAGGTVVLAGLKGADVPGFPTDTIALRRLTLRGVRAVTRPAFRRAIALLESDDPRPDLLTTHQFGLDEVGAALDALADDPLAIAVALVPGARD